MNSHRCDFCEREAHRVFLCSVCYAMIPAQLRADYEAKGIPMGPKLGAILAIMEWKQARPKQVGVTDWPGASRFTLVA